ncbi:MAG TPA: PAS domain S-box protein, partial [Rhodospirillales bacterium]|nr:PAS domain S-box protein [Rhodospirillales bacterium]
GYSREEALGCHACDIIVAPELRERVDQDWRDVIGNRGGDYAVNESIRKDGTGITCEWHNSPLINEDGGVFGISSFVRDVSRTIANQDALRASDELFERAFSSSPAMIAINDAETTRVINVNDTWLEFMGMERADVIDKTIAEIGFWAYPEDRLEFIEILEKEGFVRDLEIRVRTKKGILRDLLIVADVIDFAGKKCLMSVSLDIGEHKRTENLEARLGRVVEGSLNGIFIFGSETLRFSLVNKGARENLGYSSIELMNMTPLDIKPDDEVAKFSAMIDQLHNSWRDEITYETRHQRKDGTIYDASVRLNYLRDEVPPVYLAFVEDITERKIAEESARRSQKIEAIGHLTGGIAHDFNNLLGIILGNLDLLEEDLIARPDLLPLVETAQRAALRGSEMTKRLLSFSTKTAPRTIFVNINTSIVSMAPLIARSLSPEIEIINELAENIWITSINEGEFEDTILNLSINARKAMPEGGRLTFRTENKVIGPPSAEPSAAPGPGEYVHLTVGDSGTGIAKDIIDNIFDPFFTTDGLGAGTGLGLSMVYGFVERSGGSISVNSEPGQGTVFHIYLPRDVTGEALRDPAAVDQSIILGGRETILVVDDEPDLVNLAKGTLHRLGYSILTAGNAAQAMNILEMTEVGEIDLLFSDIVMPGDMNGLELARSAQVRDRNIRILMVTGYMQKITDADTYGDLTGNMLTKPYTRADLALGVRAALDGRS